MRATRARHAAVALILLAAGCESALPDEQSAGARVLRERCAGCHRLYPPSSMTAEMWTFQVERMRAEFARRGIPWLTAAEEAALLEYLGAHAGTS